MHMPQRPLVLRLTGWLIILAVAGLLFVLANSLLLANTAVRHERCL
jgi:hypothetical protein